MKNFDEYLRYQDERTKRLLGTNWEEKFNPLAKWPFLKTSEIPQSPFATDSAFIQALKSGSELAQAFEPNPELAQALESYKDLYNRYVRAFDRYESWFYPNSDTLSRPQTDYLIQTQIPTKNAFLDISASVIDNSLSAIHQALPFLDEEQRREYEDFFGAEDEDTETSQPSETPGKKRVHWPLIEKIQQQLMSLGHYLFDNSLLKKIIIKAGIVCAVEQLIQQIDSDPAKIALTVVINAIELIQSEIAPFLKSTCNSDDEN